MTERAYDKDEEFDGKASERAAIQKQVGLVRWATKQRIICLQSHTRHMHCSAAVCCQRKWTLYHNVHFTLITMISDLFKHDSDLFPYSNLTLKNARMHTVTFYQYIRFANCIFICLLRAVYFTYFRLLCVCTFCVHYILQPHMLCQLT